MENYNKKSYQLIYFLIIGLFLASCYSKSGLLKPYQKGNIDIADNFSIEGKFKLSMPDSKETGYFFLKKTRNLIQINIGKNYLLPEEELLVENKHRRQAYVPVKKLIQMIEENNLAISANGVFFETDRESVLSTILKKWFEERVIYKGRMKSAYKAGDTEKGEYNYLMQYTMKILLNSLYGATALGSFRYGNVILSEAITLSGQRIIQESALCANRHMNKVIRGELKLKI